MSDNNQSQQLIGNLLAPTARQRARRGRGRGRGRREGTTRLCRWRIRILGHDDLGRNGALSLVEAQRFFSAGLRHIQRQQQQQREGNALELAQAQIEAQAQA
ncbi:hypothetical protein CFAM422_006293 [Trichoderma lentiforme]|uniref:Uncharacterized protein n=1 Tax=Trichoderma lentiforme TaxID=1567552 RepID=A0A9P4XDX2_9HYPO|nr:hypothetical protein CFAM422_006293 [Trichoderma lentiforme]